MLENNNFTSYNIFQFVYALKVLINVFTQKKQVKVKIIFSFCWEVFWGHPLGQISRLPKQPSWLKTG